MKNNVFLKLLILALILWNIFLTIEVSKKPTITSDNNINSPINQNLTYTTTDLTKTAEKSFKKAVGIQTNEGSGSGAIYRLEKLDNGRNKITIITNYHVVGNSKQVMVLFANEQELVGDVIGGDLYTDLAVVTVEADFSVDVFTLGDSSTLKIGEWVLAIGSPLGFDFYGSVSEGIISGKNRQIGVDLTNDGIDDWDMIVLQTTAAINPGNSGGPLINLNGDLVGINSMKILDSRVEGMGFAIPINEVIPIITQLIETGEVKRPLLGISGRSINEYSTVHKSYLGLPLDIEEGLVVVEVLNKSAAKEAGILESDIIVEFNHVRIATFKDFRVELYKMKSGDEVEIKVIRDNKEVDLVVILK